MYSYFEITVAISNCQTHRDLILIKDTIKYLFRHRLFAAGYEERVNRFLELKGNTLKI